MIIDQESHVRKSQVDCPEPDVPVATSTTPLIPAESPPAYTPREAYVPPSSSSTPYHNTLPPPAAQKRPRKRAVKRFVKAFILALCIYAAIGLVFRFLFFVFRGPRPPRPPPPHGPHGRDGRPKPEDVRIIYCSPREERPWPLSAPVRFSTFEIPLSSSGIFILARGRQATGRVRVELDQTTVSDDITVDITARYHDWEAPRGTSICLMEKERGELGVGVFTPNHWDRVGRQTDFQVTVRIPHQPASPVTELSRFEILAPDFQINLPNIEEVVHFQNLTIRTSGKPVAVDSVKATYIDIKTSNADIHGTFITNSSLGLTTSGASIKANIFLENDSTSGKETSVYATTTSGSLTGAISLSNAGAPRYAVHASTTNANLNLSFLQDRDSSRLASLPTLDIFGSTSNGPAELLLQLPFEGSFDVSTSPSHRADFFPGSRNGGDPLGLGRKQNIELTTDEKSRKEGRVYWGDLNDGRKLGRVELSTSNGPASLQI